MNTCRVLNSMQWATVALGIILLIVATQIVKSDEDMVQKYNRIMTSNIDSLEKLADIYPKSVMDIHQWTDAAMQLARSELEEILAIAQQDRTYKNTMQALDVSQNKLQTITAIFGMLAYTHPDQAIRDAVLASKTILQDLSIDLYMNPELYQAMQKYSDERRALESLSSDDELLLSDFLKGCKRAGLHLPAPILDQVKQMQKELALMEKNFQTNINTDNRTITCSLDELQGMSEDFIKQLKKDSDLYVVPCDLPFYVPIMQECSVAQTRRKLFLARANQAYPENDALLMQILQKRDELAELIGYENFASLDLDQTSAKNSATVQSFLTKLAHAAKHKAEKEIDLLKSDLPESVVCRTNGALNPWDYLYTETQYNKKHFDIDESAISEYLPVDKVIDGIFEIYQKFLGLTFKKVKPVWSWSDDVYLIEIYRTSSDELLGYLFLDLYPRPNKYKHACVCPQVGSYAMHGHKHNTSVAVMICNFPQAAGDKPALFKHNDVVTFFHEFGHAMHNVLGRTKHAGHNGCNVAPDFVETPSQMFEEWMFEPEMLAKVSGHYKTNEPMPAKMLKKKIELRQSDSGYTYLRQCMFALFSLELMTHDKLSYQPAKLWKSLHKKYIKSLIGYEDDNHWYATFGHLASGLYASKYYCYLWTKVFAIDLFSEIKKHEFDDEYSAKVVKLLSAGGSVESEDLLQEFLGRKPNQEAFLSVLGLKGT